MLSKIAEASGYSWAVLLLYLVLLYLRIKYDFLAGGGFVLLTVIFFFVFLVFAIAATVKENIELKKDKYIG